VGHLPELTEAGACRSTATYHGGAVHISEPVTSATRAAVFKSESQPA
jgi:hypothetical protein